MLAFEATQLQTGKVFILLTLAGTARGAVRMFHLQVQSWFRRTRASTNAETPLAEKAQLGSTPAD